MNGNHRRKKAKIYLPKLLERVSKGEQIIITRHGMPAAVLLSPDCQHKAGPPGKIIDELRNFRKQHHLAGLSVREMIDEGRR